MDNSDRSVLRQLAERVAEIADLPEQRHRAEAWRRLNQLEPERPLVITRLWPYCWQEVLPDETTLQTTDETAREYERRLRQRVWEWENLTDDRVVEPVIEYPQVCHWDGWFGPRREFPDDRSAGAYRPVPVIIEKSDIEKIIVPTITFDAEATASNREEAEEIFGDILKVRAAPPPHAGSSMGDEWCELRGMEQAFLDMVMDPAWTHEALERLTQAWIGRLTQCEEQGMLRLNNNADPIYNVGPALTDELPAAGHDPEHVRLKDVWGFSTAQAFISVSPAMHEEFMFQYERRALKHFGLNCVACCENVDTKLDGFLSLPNLRKVAVSEWNDFATVAEGLGGDYVFSYRPSGIALGDPIWNPEAIRVELREVIDKSRGCAVEIVNNIGGSCYGEPRRLLDWTEIAMELVRERSH
ncbi:MAG TPA: hypothetical protein QGH10_22965 [Armatimonadota bacterium]|nr:hypothetical protein [Armatimonadota bacterium]